MPEEEKEKAAYWKGKYEGMKEAMQKGKTKVASTGSMIKQSLIDYTIRYVLIALFLIGVGAGTYYYVSTKVTETVSEIKQDVKDAIPHPVEATKKWFKKEHWWNKKDDNKTEEVTKTVESVEVVEVKKEILQDENQTGFIAKAKEKFAGLKFWGDDNESKE